MAELKKYNTTATIYFPLVTYTTSDYDLTIDSSAVNFVEGDVQISKDYNAFANTHNFPEHLGNGVYKLELTAEELTASNIVITIISQASPKDWEDQGANIDTFGNASAALAQNLDESFETSLTNVLMSDLAKANPSGTASIVYAINFLYELGRNKTETTAARITVYRDDGLEEAFRSSINDDGATFTKGELGTGV